MPGRPALGLTAKNCLQMTLCSSTVVPCPPRSTPTSPGSARSATRCDCGCSRLLRGEGPATATTLAARLDLNTGATSYHLRQLAQHGFIEEDSERGNARDRWWRAAHESTRTDFREKGIVDSDVEAYLTTVALMYADRMRAAVSEMPFLPEEWRPVGTLSDWEVRLTPARAEALVQELAAVIEDADDSDADGPRRSW